jgi:RHS repeat-associated protein
VLNMIIFIIICLNVLNQWRTAIVSCDSGRTEYKFDLAGNQIAMSTSALRAEDPTKAVRYDYEFDRKMNITFPNYPGNNVVFVYGTNTPMYQAHNQVGRVMFVTDESGAVILEYDEIGGKSREIKTVATHNKPATYVMEYVYDSYGRIREMTYPDGEVVTHEYDSGGHLCALHGLKTGVVSNFVLRKEYTEFGQTAYVVYGNGVATSLTYVPLDPGCVQHRVATSPDPDYAKFQDMNYIYDLAKNPVAISNPIVLGKHAQYGGPSWFTFEYDDLDRMIYSTGTYSNASKQDIETFFLNMSYNNEHGITEKNQQVFDGKIPQQKQSFDFDYAYGGGPAHAPSQVGNVTYKYDANGNTILEDDDLSGKRVTFEFDELNIVQVVNENGNDIEFNYDYTGERVIKRASQGEIAYVNRHFTIRNSQTVEKHFFAGDMRVSSHLIQNAFNQTQPDKDLALYYFHYDHLKSAHWITGANGSVFQHLEYFPAGETWMEEGSPSQRIPFNWIDEELDVQDNLYYLHERYYDPRTSLFVSPDPALGAFLNGKGKGGVFDPRNLNLYAYGFNSPHRYSDKTGLAPQDDKEMVVLNEVMYGTYENPTTANIQHALQQQATKFPALRPELSRLKVLSASKNSEIFEDTQTHQGFAVARGTQVNHWNTGPADIWQDAKITAGFNPGSRDAEFATALDATRKANPQIKSWTVTGHSLGGRVAEDYASNHPDVHSITFNAARPGLSWGEKTNQQNMKEYHTKWDFISWGKGPAATRVETSTSKWFKHSMDYYSFEMEGRPPKSGAVDF